MIPMGRLSSEVVYAPYREPDDREPPNALADYELGGRALNDAGEGLEVHDWFGYADGAGDVYLSAPGQPETLVFSAPGITELSFCFDQNMRPFFAYVQSGQARFRWYDTVLGANRITDLDPADIQPRCCMDDKRDFATSLGQNDIILAYVRGGNLYYRQQRDRYENEYLLHEGVPGNLLRVGMNQGLRLQFLFEDA